MDTTVTDEQTDLLKSEDSITPLFKNMDSIMTSKPQQRDHLSLTEMEARVNRVSSLWTSMDWATNELRTDISSFSSSTEPRLALVATTHESYSPETTKSREFADMDIKLNVGREWVVYKRLRISQEWVKVRKSTNWDQKEEQARQDLATLMDIINRYISGDRSIEVTDHI